MLEQESIYLRSIISSLDLPAGSRILNFGSQRQSVLRYQPYIDDNIYGVARTKQWKIVNFDLIEGPGVDLHGDIMEAGVFDRLKQGRFAAVFVFNVLEHLENVGEICRRLEDLVSPGAYIVLSVPRKYPTHYDPIDNGFRPDVQQLVSSFPRSKMMDGAVVEDRTFGYYLLRNRRRLLKYLVRIGTPFFRPKNWWTQVLLLPYLFKRFQVSCVLLRRVGG